MLNQMNKNSTWHEHRLEVRMSLELVKALPRCYSRCILLVPLTERSNSFIDVVVNLQDQVSLDIYHNRFSLSKRLVLESDILTMASGRKFVKRWVAVIPALSIGGKQQNPYVSLVSQHKDKLTLFCLI